jgi:hypothetical protein
MELWCQNVESYNLLLLENFNKAKERNTMNGEDKGARGYSLSISVSLYLLFYSFSFYSESCVLALRAYQ